MATLPCSTIVYRAMARKDWIDRTTGQVLPAAFFRRPPPQNEDGLSVDFASARSCSKSLGKRHAVVSLHVGRVRDLQLDVVPDELSHANVTGLPRKEDDRTNAEHLASELAKQARNVPPDKYLSSV